MSLNWHVFFVVVRVVSFTVVLRVFFKGVMVFGVFESPKAFCKELKLEIQDCPTITTVITWDVLLLSLVNGLFHPLYDK